MRVGLALSGGGARGAYQVGALQALSELLARRRLPFDVLVGASAGAITSSFLAARASNFPLSVKRLVDFWGHIRPEYVFRTDARTLTQVGMKWMVDLSLGGWIGRHRAKALLMSDPLRALLEERLDIGAVHDNIERGLLHGIALTTTDYRTSMGVTFFDGVPEIAPWTRSTRYGVRARLTIDHVMASSAIPIFFPAIRIGERYYADGCLRSVTPLSPAVHLGAERILAIGIRQPGVQLRQTMPDPKLDKYPSIADTAGLLLNAIFVEALESDIERLERVNETLNLVPDEVIDANATMLRRIPLYVLRPSRDLGALARDTLTKLPSMIQYLFRGLGVSDRTGWDLLSYLAFDRTYTSKLLALGYSDVMADAEALVHFITPPAERDASEAQA
ncbi:MAG: patatin-like phospholipase family protein [Polyangiaceae bacterium]|nr:patatin-like phospholipase family protein [Polyangiaceae bacterium]